MISFRIFILILIGVNSVLSGKEDPLTGDQTKLSNEDPLEMKMTKVMAELIKFPNSNLANLSDQKNISDMLLLLLRNKAKLDAAQLAVAQPSEDLGTVEFAETAKTEDVEAGVLNDYEDLIAQIAEHVAGNVAEVKNNEESDNIDDNFSNAGSTTENSIVSEHTTLNNVTPIFSTERVIISTVGIKETAVNENSNINNNNNKNNNDNNKMFLEQIKQLLANNKGEVLSLIQETLTEPPPTQNVNPFIPLITSISDIVQRPNPIFHNHNSKNRHSSISKVVNNGVTRGTCKFDNDDNINVEINFVQESPHAIPTVTRTIPRTLLNPQAQLQQCISLSSNQNKIVAPNPFDFNNPIRSHQSVMQWNSTPQKNQGSTIVSDYDPIKRIHEPKKPVDPLTSLDKIHQRILENEQDLSRPKHMQLKRIADKMKRNPILKSRYTNYRSPSMEDAQELKLLVESYIILLQE